MFKEINIGGYVLRFYPTDNKGWMCGITDEQLKALMSITTLFTHPAKTLTDEEIAVIWANHSVPMTGMEFKKVVEAILKKANNG